MTAPLLDHLVWSADAPTTSSFDPLTEGERIWLTIVDAMHLPNQTFAAQLRECRVHRYEPDTLLVLETPSEAVKWCIRYMYPETISEARDRVAPGVRLAITVRA